MYSRRQTLAAPAAGPTANATRYVNDIFSNLIEFIEPPVSGDMDCGTSQNHNKVQHSSILRLNTEKTPTGEIETEQRLRQFQIW